jgi:hypothetical protein
MIQGSQPKGFKAKVEKRKLRTAIIRHGALKQNTVRQAGVKQG